MNVVIEIRLYYTSDETDVCHTRTVEIVDEWAGHGEASQAVEGAVYDMQCEVERLGLPNLRPMTAAERTFFLAETDRPILPLRLIEGGLRA